MKKKNAAFNVTGFLLPHIWQIQLLGNKIKLFFFSKKKEKKINILKPEPVVKASKCFLL